MARLTFFCFGDVSKEYSGTGEKRIENVMEVCDEKQYYK